MSRTALLTVVAMLVLVTGCDSTPKSETNPGANDSNQTPATSAGSPDQPYHFDGHGANVSAKAFGKSWPLTVRSGRVNCVPAGGKNIMVVFTANNDTRYAINGTARSRAADYGFRDVQKIWADDPKYPGLKKDISVLIDVCSPLME